MPDSTIRKHRSDDYKEICKHVQSPHQWYKFIRHNNDGQCKIEVESIFK